MGINFRKAAKADSAAAPAPSNVPQVGRERLRHFDTELAKGHGGFGAPRPRYAIALGCEISYTCDFVYADGLDLMSKTACDPIGISCRICQRTNCPQRAVPPLKSRLTVHSDRRDILPYDIS